MVVYSLDPETFYDENGDGVGDLTGLADRLDYLAGMGINCLWVLPFYPSPNRDNGYDVMDYYNVDPRLGTLGTFAEFVDRANDVGIRVLIDLVVNHTSVRHPWFVEARKDRHSKYRDYYVWADEPWDFDDEDITLIGEENTIWTYDKEARQYYLHRFYKEQPDLNIANPEVRHEIMRIIGFWLKMGVSGFRVDAAEFLIHPYGLKGVKAGQLTGFLEEMRDFITLRKGDAILLAETNIRPGEMQTYLDGGRKMHMLFNFYLNQHLFLALARESAAPLYKAVVKLPELHGNNQLLNFLRHHDELSLKLLTGKEREDIFAAFAPDKRMRIYGHGIRRRLAPILNNDRKRMELSFSLLFTLPGVPMIRYGDEIGMGDNLALKGRGSVRTAMQWSDDLNGGFSAYTGRLPHPVIGKGPYGFPRVNVVKAHRDSGSFLNWMERLIAARKQCSVIGNGKTGLIKAGVRSAFIHSYRERNAHLVFIHNLAPREVIISRAEIKLTGTDYFEFFSDDRTEVSEHEIKLYAYGYIWLKSIKI